MSDKIKLFTSHASLSRGGILSFEARGESSAHGPKSIVDICCDHNLSQCINIESNFTSYFQAYQNLKAQKIQFIFGLKIKMCSDMLDKSENSTISEHKIIILQKNTEGYDDLVKIYTLAACKGIRDEVPRIDAKSLCKLWNNDNLMLMIPFYGSFLARNTLTFSECNPDFSFSKEVIFLEEENELPFDSLISSALRSYTSIYNHKILPSQTIYYYRPEDYKSFLTYRTVLAKTKFSKPNMDGMFSNKFCFLK